MAVTDSPAELTHEAALHRIKLEEAIAFTQDGGFHGPDGFAKIMDDGYPTWPSGSLLGIELLSMGDGESRWALDAGPGHANPMGTIHGGVLCDLGDAALSTAYMSTLESDIDGAVSEAEQPALLFALHYAETDGNPAPNVLAAVEAAYDPATAADIVAFTQAMHFANLLGNTVDAGVYAIERRIDRGLHHTRKRCPT